MPKRMPKFLKSPTRPESKRRPDGKLGQQVVVNGEQAVLVRRRKDGLYIARLVKSGKLLLVRLRSSSPASKPAPERRPRSVWDDALGRPDSFIQPPPQPTNGVGIMPFLGLD